MENISSASERWLLLGAPNARDLGGLPTMDGRTIRPGLLLRSGELAGITEPDAQTLTKYPLRTVVDFRTALAREQKPARVLPGAACPGRTKIVKAGGIRKFIFQLPGDILSAGKIAGSAYKPPPSPIFRGAPSPPRRPRESGAGGGNQIPCRFFWHISC